MTTKLKVIGLAALFMGGYLVGEYRGYHGAVAETVKAFMNTTNSIHHKIVRSESAVTYGKNEIDGIHDLLNSIELSTRFKSTFDETQADLVFGYR